MGDGGGGGDGDGQSEGSVMTILPWIFQIHLSHNNYTRLLYCRKYRKEILEGLNQLSYDHTFQRS